MNEYKLFRYLYTKGNVDYYEPNEEFEIYVDAIDVNSGNIDKKKVLQYTIHRNLRMYKISDLQHRFEDFWVSDDHSLIVYNGRKQKLERISPIEILNSPDTYFLIKKTSSNNLAYIPCSEIQIEYDPTVTEAADFTVEDYYTFCTADGIFVQDTVAIFTPITEEALEDVKYKMTNLLHSANPRRLMINFDKDVSVGICLATMDPHPDAKKHYPWLKAVKYNGVQTTEGRIAIWNMLPDSVKGTIFKFEDFNKQIDIDYVISTMVEHDIPKDDILSFVYKLQQYALDCVTKASESIDIRTFEISEEVSHYINLLDKTKDPLKQQEILDQLNKVVMTKLSNTDIKYLLECGAFKKNQLFQLLGSKGLMLSPDGKLVLVKSNFTKGLKPTEFFNASHGARTGIISRTNKTAITGYLMRKLVYGLSSVRLDSNNPFCGTPRLLSIKVDSDLSVRIINRYAIVDSKLTLLTREVLSELQGKEIQMYSPIYCRSAGICLRCFGRDYELLGSTEIGTLAAQSIGERLTQEMLKAFHTGGVVKPVILDFYENVSENTRLTKEKLQQIFSRKENTYFLNKDCTITFKRDDGYNLSTFLKSEEDELELEYIICTVECENEILDIVFDGRALLYNPGDITVEKTKFILKYNKGQQFLRVLPEVSDMELISKRILSTVEGRSVVKDEYHLLQKIYRYIRPMGNINLVWIEILVSQLLRDKSNISIPARLGKDWNPVIVSIKQLPYLESWVRGLEFENFGKSVTNALLQENIVMPSRLDELLL